MIEDKEEFNKLYNNVINLIFNKLVNISKLRVIGYNISSTNIKILNLYVRYLEDIKESKYLYITINTLITINNFLNKI